MNTQLRKHVWWMPGAVLAIALVGHIGYLRAQTTPRALHASWTLRPQSVEEARDKAQLVVHGEIVRVQNGDDLVVAAPGEPTGEDRVPTQRVTVRVGRALKGEVKDGQILTLFQTGGVQLPTDRPDGKQNERISARQVILDSDPLYQVGEQYLFMLDAGPKGMHKVVAPEGRYRIERSGRLAPMVDNDVTRAISGKPIGEVERLLAG